MGQDSSDYLGCDMCGYEICIVVDALGVDSGLYDCEKGHVFCKDCYPEFHENYSKLSYQAQQIKDVVNRDDNARKLFSEEEIGLMMNEWSDDKVIEEGSDALCYLYPIVTSSQCPVCTSGFKSDDEILEFMLKKFKVTREDITKEMNNG